MVLGAQGPNSAEIIAFFDRNCCGGRQKTIFFGTSCKMSQTRGETGLASKDAQTDPRWSRKIFAKKYFQTRGEIRF